MLLGEGVESAITSGNVLLSSPLGLKMVEGAGSLARFVAGFFG